jgi:hypothetical protein
MTMNNVVRLNIQRNAQTQNQESPYGQVTNLLVDIEEQMDAVIRQLFKESDTYAGHLLSAAKIEVRASLHEVLESLYQGEH